MTEKNINQLLQQLQEFGVSKASEIPECNETEIPNELAILIMWLMQEWLIEKSKRMRLEKVYKEVNSFEEIPINITNHLS